MPGRGSAALAVALAATVGLPASAHAATDDRVAVVVSGFRLQGDLRIATLQADGAERRDVDAPGVQLLGADWSPDGSELAALVEPQFADGPTSLRVFAQDGSAQRTLATDAADPFAVRDGLAWTDDGSHLAYLSGRPGDTRLSLVRRDGRARTTVDTGVRDMQVLQWSPDGSLVTFTSRTPEGAVGLFAVRPDGSGLRQLADQSGAPDAPRGLSWSPDGDRFVYLRNAPEHLHEPRIVRRDGTVERVLPVGASRGLPQWSPDGTTISVPTAEGVVLHDVDTGEQRPLGFRPPEGHYLWVVPGGAWSPDSRHLLVLTEAAAQPFPAPHLWVVDVQTGEGRELVLDARVGSASFAPLPTTTPAVRTTEQACTGAPSAEFFDTVGNLFEAAIDCVAWYGVARGVTDWQYSPGAIITRPQMAQFLTRTAAVAGLELDTSDAGFHDLDGLSDEARDAVNAAANLGIARGTSATEFGVGSGVTRGQMASFLVRLHRVLTGEELGPRVHCFADVSASVHRAAAERLCGAGITTGAVRGAYDPAPAVTRQQMAGFLARLLDLEVATGRISRPE